MVIIKNYKMFKDTDGEIITNEKLCTEEKEHTVINETRMIKSII